MEQQLPWFDKEHEQELVKDLGLFAVKTTITLCAGGFLAILTFWSNMAGNESLLINTDRLRFSLLLLLGGLFFAMLAIFVSFLIAQFRLGNGGATKLDRTKEHWFLIVQTSPLLIAFALFICGVSFAIFSFG